MSMRLLLLLFALIGSACMGYGWRATPSAVDSALHTMRRPGAHQAFAARRMAHEMLAGVDPSGRSSLPLSTKKLSMELDSPETSNDVATAVIEVDRGVVLVTGGSCGVGRAFVDSTFGQFAAKCTYVREGGDLTSEEQVEALLSEVARAHAETPIVGLVHFGQGESQELANIGTSATEGIAVLDSELRSLALLVSRIVPTMQLEGVQCRIVTISDGQVTRSPSDWRRGKGMKALVKGFVEQYTEALAEELHGSNIVVFCVRIASAEGEDLLTKLRAAWEMPALEAHGRIIILEDPALGNQFSKGGNIIGPSIDSRWALRGAAGQAAHYPADFLPRAYAALAKALKFERDSIVWCHGASDLLVRVAALAAAYFHGFLAVDATSDNLGPPRATLQDPSWPRAPELIKSGGLDMTTVSPYFDPWEVEENRENFWNDLETLLTTDPPALVYLVDPHFPSGHKTVDLSIRLDRLLKLTKGNVLFAVDQTYLGFTNRTEDDDAVESLALSNDALVLVRSLSKVEGLAALRLGYAIASPTTMARLKSVLPFSGDLYVSELALDGALAAISGKAAQRHKESVLAFYESERDWFATELVHCGLQVSPTDVALFFVVKGPAKVLQAAIAAGAIFERTNFPQCKRVRQNRGGVKWGDGAAVVLVCDRATNRATLAAVCNAFQTNGMNRNSANM